MSKKEHRSASDAENILVEIAGASKIYASNDSKPTWAVLDVSMKLNAGEMVCVLGPSGCGKTTLLNMIAGFTDATHGSVRIGGNNVVGPGQDRGVVFQEYALFAWMTARQNIEFGLKMRGASKRKRRERANEYLKLMGLVRAADQYPHELSGGMRQRIAVARALVNEPQVLLMDEPFAAVDAITRATLQDELLRVWQKLKPAVFFITHNVEEAIYLSQKTILMSPHPGQIQEIIEINLPYPRDRGSPEFGALYASINSFLHGN